MLTLYEKNSVNKIIDYLIKIQENYQSELNTLENDIKRIKRLIKDAEKSKIEVQSSLDTSYMVLSSSQVANTQQFAEIDSFEELIELRNKELDELNCKKIIVEGRLTEVNEIINCAEDLNK